MKFKLPAARLEKTLIIKELRRGNSNLTPGQCGVKFQDKIWVEIDIETYRKNLDGIEEKEIIHAQLRTRENNKVQ